MLKSNKNVFWEALMITLVIFLLGILIGVMIENERTRDMNEYYSKSEISLVDIQSMQKLINSGNLNCDSMNEANLRFADRIYEEAELLSDYEEAGKITESIKIAHKRYDILRTLLWLNSIEAHEKCEDDFSVVVYLYEYEPKDLTIKAQQVVWSKILSDLKESFGDKIILIPIAYNRDLVTLDILVENLKITQFPVVIINNKYVISELTSVVDLEKYLN